MECLRVVVTQLHQIAKVIYLDSHSIATADKRLVSVLDYVDTLERHHAEYGESIGERHILHIISLMAASLKDDRLAASLCILVFCKLVLAGLQSSASTKLVTRGFNRSLQRMIQIWKDDNDTLAIKFDWTNECDVLAVIASRLSTHRIASLQPKATIHCISQQILRVVQVTAYTRLGLDSGDLCMNYHTVAGPDVCKSRALESTLLMDIPVATDTALAILNVEKRRGFVIALFDCSLELPEGNTKQSLQMEIDTVAERASNRPSAEIELLEGFALQLHRSHVTFVGCQKRVHPYLLRRLRALRIVCVARISIRFMAALQRLSAARQLSSIAPLSVLQHSCLDPASLGYFHAVDYQHIYGKPFIVVQGYTSRCILNDTTDADSEFAIAAAFQDHLLDTFEHLPVEFLRPYVKAVAARRSNCTTMLVTAPTEALAKQWRDAIECTIAYLRKLRKEADPRVLPGGGIWLAALARELEVTMPRSDAGGQTSGVCDAAEPLSRQQRQIRATELEFQQIIKECAVLAGGVNNGAYSDAGESCVRDTSEFVFPTRGAAAGSVDLEYRNPRGDIVPVRRIDSPQKHAEPLLCTYSLHSEGCVAKLTSVPLLSVKLDNFDANMRALAIATDMACTLLEVDGFISTAAPTTEHV